MSSTFRHVKWDEIPKEKVADSISRRIVSSDQVMVSQIYLDKGAVVPKHSHENEQFTTVLKGALCFWLGENLDKKVIVEEGEMLYIPSNMPHQAEALKDTLDVDVFSPPRKDWLDGTDTYFNQVVS